MDLLITCPLIKLQDASLIVKDLNLAGIVLEVIFQILQFVHLIVVILEK